MKDVERGEKGTKLHATGSALYTYRYLPLINTKHVLNFFYCHLFRVHELLTTTLFMLLCNRSHTHTLVVVVIRPSVSIFCCRI